MKKTGAKRVSGYDTGLGSAVLTAPEEMYASEAEIRGSRKGPAPAGALQRGFGSDAYDESGGYGQDDAEYGSQRGKLRLRFGSLTRSVGGRIVLGVVSLVLVAAAVVAFAQGRSYLMHDGRFVLASSDDIQITGAEHLTRDQILSVFGADLERNIFRVSLAERQTDLERLPWVAHATVMRLLPDVLRVQITERTPVAFVRQGSQIGLVDGSGVLLDMPADAPGNPHYSFPVLTGLTVDEAASERASKMEVYEQFMRELDGSGQHLTDSVSEVDVTDPEDVKALITSGSSDIQVHFGQEQFLHRYQEFEGHLAEWKQQYPKLASADMRYDGQIVLEMQGDGGAASGAAVETASAGVATSVVAKPEVVAKPVASVKPAAPKALATKPANLKAAAPKPVPTVAAAKPAVGKPAAGKPVLHAAVGKPLVPDLSDDVVTKPAAPKPVVLGIAPNAVGARPAGVEHAVPVNNFSTNSTSRFTAGTTEKKTTAAAKAKAPSAAKAVAWKPAGKARPGSGMSAANAKVFARLAAEHRAELAKEHKTGTANAAKSGRPGTKSGVTP